MADQLHEFPELEHLDSRLDHLAAYGAAHSAAPEPAFVRRRAGADLRRRGLMLVVVVAVAACVLGIVAFGLPSILRGGGSVVPAPPVGHPRILPTTPVPGSATVPIGTVLSVDLPPGWTEVINDGFGPADETDYYCLAPANASGLGCQGVSVTAGKHLPGNEGSAYRPNEVAGWDTGTDVMPCPIGTSSAGSFNGVNPGGRPVVEALRKVGSHEAYYDKWRATCADGSVFFPQAWYLPDSHVLVKTVLDVPEVTSILKSAAFVREGASVVPQPVARAVLLAATDGAVRLSVGGRHTVLLLSTRTACLGGARVAGRAAELVTVPCGRFADWKKAHPGRRLSVIVYTDGTGGVAQIAEH
ncbi:MAG: hypothetical protein ACRDPI_09095 [Nocardioidaceae bacterium]